MKLFETEKVPMFLDSFAPRLEKRGGDEHTVRDLTLRIQPLTPELASACSGDDLLKRSLFKLTDGEPLPGITSVGFSMAPPRQRLLVYASPDTEAPSIMFDQVRVSKVRARVEKGCDGWALVMHASFGPISKVEAEYIEAWYTTQRFVTFEEAEPTLDFDEFDTMSDADEKAQGNAIDGRVVLEFQGGATLSEAPAPDSEKAIEEGHRYTKPKGRKRSKKATTAIDEAAAILAAENAVKEAEGANADA